MLSIAELAHQRDPQAIAEIIRQEFKNLDSQHLVDVEVTIVDSNLELQIQTDSAIDKEKLLTLVSSKLQNLHIESVAKFKVYCWRNDEEMRDRHLLWTEQVMLEPLQTSLSQTLEIESDNPKSLELPSPEIRSQETQLSKHSVLQKAIANLSKNNPKVKTHLHAAEQIEEPVLAKSNALSSTAIVPRQAEKTQSTNNNGQLLLVGLAIVLFGFGIGAFARAITSKSAVDPNVAISSTNTVKASVDKSAIQNNQNTKSPKSNTVVTTQSTSTLSNSDLTPANINLSSNGLQDDRKTITLDQFNRVQKGMTVDQVEKIFGVSGKVIAENTVNDSVGRVYSWKNPQGSNAIVEFKDGQVVAKAQAGL